MNIARPFLCLSLLSIAAVGCRAESESIDSHASPIKGSYGYEMMPELILEAPAEALSVPAEVPGRLPPEVIRDVVRSGQASFAACTAGYDDLVGEVRVKAFIDEKGQVSNARFVVAPDRRLGECTRSAISGLQFPVSHDGAAEVIFSIVFST